MTTAAPYPIGTPGIPWDAAEVETWRSRQVRQRSYQDEVLARIEALRSRYDVSPYGQLDYQPDHYPLMAIRSRHWSDELPVMLVTGGVHGYETSGVHGALQFVEDHAQLYAGRINLIVAPCVSPWGYERIHRWNPQALDPNRAFRSDSLVPEATALKALVEPLGDQVLMHIDLHETTDTDESEFGPARAARDGSTYRPVVIPDGFYLVGNSENPQPAFQQAIIQAVSLMTHIAQTDSRGTIIGLATASPGVVNTPSRRLGVCGGITAARYTTTTEVYPDSARTTAQQCNAAQVAAVCAAIDFALAT